MKSGGTVTNAPTREGIRSHWGFTLGARETGILVGLALAMAGMLVVASLVTSRYHKLERALSASWFERGERQMASGKPEAAVQDFRNALAYSRDSRQYQLQLAQALIASGHTTEARAYLLSLWERRPGDGVLNLLLARLAAKEGNFRDAMTYYRNAIYGQWQEQPEEHRRTTRFELAEFLLAHKMIPEARAELISLSADMPRNPQMLTRLGQEFLATGDPGDAFNQFTAALQVDPAFRPALGGAGESAYLLGDYSTAKRYLTDALKTEIASSKGPSAQEPQTEANWRQMLDVSDKVLTMDPYKPGLQSAERARRVSDAFQVALKRVKSCAGVSSNSVSAAKPGSEAGQTLSSTKTSDNSQVSVSQGGPVSNPALATLLAPVDNLQQAANSRNLRHDLDLQNDIMSWIFQAEQTTARICGQPTGADQALLVLAKQHGFTQQ